MADAIAGADLDFAGGSRTDPGFRETGFISGATAWHDCPFARKRCRIRFNAKTPGSKDAIKLSEAI